MKKHKVLKLALLAVGMLLLAAAIGAWSMFGTQLKAVGTIEKLDEHLYMLEYEGDYGFDAFLAQGGAASDAEMADYIAAFLSHGFWKPDTESMPGMDLGCSTISVKDSAGNVVFGRNFDWVDCQTMLVHTIPEGGYESFSTCCLDFLGFGEDWAPEGMMNKLLSLSAVYVPLDGMNERGLCVADLVAGDDVETHQNTEKPDITIAPAIRLLLDHAGSVDEAIKLLSEYDMNSSIGTAHHLSISDAAGMSVVVEYIDGEMAVSQTPIVTNHYLSAGEKQGIGSEQSHSRFDILSARYAEAGGVMDRRGVKDCMASVAQRNFPNSDERTQWSLVCDTASLTADVYFRENFESNYTIRLGAKGADWLSK